MTPTTDTVPPRFYVGQTVIRRDVNEDRLGGTQKLTVTKVGRVLVTATSPGGYAETFRMDTGYRNDQYGHGWIQTPEDFAAEQERHAVMTRLRSLGVQWDYGSPQQRWTTDTLARVADLLEAEARP